VKDIHDVIKHANFGDDRLRGSGVVAGQISAFPIDFAGRPYNTLTLPCERVIFFPIKYTEVILPKAFGDCCGLKLPKCRLQFKEINLLCHLL